MIVVVVGGSDDKHGCHNQTKECASCEERNWRIESPKRGERSSDLEPCGCLGDISRRPAQLLLLSSRCKFVNPESDREEKLITCVRDEK